MMAPALRSCDITNASLGTIEPSKANDPAVVFIPSDATVAMLSLTRTGIPCSSPLDPIAFRSKSSAAASSNADGLVSSTARSAAPCKLTSSMRAKYA